MKAMIFAAGLGTRLGVETSKKPKALVKIGEKTLLELSIEKLKYEGISEVIVNVHHFSKVIIEFLTKHNFGIPIHISDETEKLLDTGGGLKKAARFLKGPEPILIYNVDILCDIKLQKVIKSHVQSGALATLVVRNRRTQRYLKFDNKKQLTGWINKKTSETKIALPETFAESLEMAFSGIHIVQADIFDFMPAEDKFSIIPFYIELAKTQLIKGYFDDSEKWMDVGKLEQLELARKLYV